MEFLSIKIACKMNKIVEQRQNNNCVVEKKHIDPLQGTIFLECNNENILISYLFALSINKHTIASKSNSVTHIIFDEILMVGYNMLATIIYSCKYLEAST
jgi:hypothetical protein